MGKVFIGRIEYVHTKENGISLIDGQVINKLAMTRKEDESAEVLCTKSQEDDVT